MHLLNIIWCLYIPTCNGGLLGDLWGEDASVGQRVPELEAAIAAGNYGVDVSTQIHGHLNRNTLQVHVF